jgi:hypothetical protein
MLSVATIIASCGLATSALGQFLVDDMGATPNNNVILENLVGGSTKATGNSGTDYLNNPPPGQTFTLGTASTLGAVTVQGNGDAGYWDSTGADAQNLSGVAAGLQWNIEIGQVNANGSITRMLYNSVVGFAPTVDDSGNGNTYMLTYTLSNWLTLAAGQEYEFSMNLVNLNSDGNDSTWYGLQKSLADVVPGTEFSNGSVVGSFGETVVPDSGDLVYILQSVPEPTTIALLSLGGLALMAFRRRD